MPQYLLTLIYMYAQLELRRKQNILPIMCDLHIRDLDSDAVGTKRSVINTALLIMESLFVHVSSIGIALLLSIDVTLT